MGRQTDIVYSMPNSSKLSIHILTLHFLTVEPQKILTFKGLHGQLWLLRAHSQNRLSLFEAVRASVRGSRALRGWGNTLQGWFMDVHQPTFCSSDIQG